MINISSSNTSKSSIAGAGEPTKPGVGTSSTTKKKQELYQQQLNRRWRKCPCHGPAFDVNNEENEEKEVKNWKKERAAGSRTEKAVDKAKSQTLPVSPEKNGNFQPRHDKEPPLLGFLLLSLKPS